MFSCLIVPGGYIPDCAFSTAALVVYDYTSIFLAAVVICTIFRLSIN